MEKNPTRTSSVTTALILLGALLLPLLCEATDPIYVVRGPRGIVTFTTRKPESDGSYQVFQPRNVAFSLFHYGYGYRRGWSAIPRTSAYDGMIRGTATNYALDPALMRAVVHVESAFNPHARSYKGAMGLMQLMPDTARRFGVSNAYHPEQNVEGGAKYLRFLLDRYSGNERLAIAAYNAGEGAVDEFGTIPPYQETQTYVRRVLKMKEVYSRVEPRTGKSVNME